MSSQVPINRSPCASCPYRRDVPSGIWSTEEYDKILPYDRETWAQPLRLFMCHQADGYLCRGWLDTHGSELLALRMAAIKGEVDSQAVDQALSEGPLVPVFQSAAEASDHGRKEIDRPKRKARAMVRKIKKRRKGTP